MALKYHDRISRPPSSSPSSTASLLRIVTQGLGKIRVCRFPYKHKYATAGLRRRLYDQGRGEELDRRDVHQFGECLAPV